MQGKQLQYQITDKEDGWTVEKVLRTCLALSRAQIRSAKYVENGITKNNHFCRTNEILRRGDVLKYQYAAAKPSVVSKEYSSSKKQFSSLHSSISVLYEDEDLCIVDKPSGIVCHPSHGHFEDSLLGFVAAISSTVSQEDLRCVGRLDKDTSGIVVFAKNRLSAARLAKQRENGMFHKEYFALVHDPFLSEQRQGRISYSLQKKVEQNSSYKITKMEVCPDGTGLSATTDYEVLCQDSTMALVRCILETGRTHQIRVHMAAIGHPLFGDPLYGRKDGGSRAALHAGILYLHQPITEEPLYMESFRTNMFD